MAVSIFYIQALPRGRSRSYPPRCSGSCQKTAVKINVQWRCGSELQKKVVLCWVDRTSRYQNDHDQGPSRLGHQPTSDTFKYASTGLVCQGRSHSLPSQMFSSSQAPHVFGLPEKNSYQSLHHQAQPTGVYNKRRFRPGQDRDAVFYNNPGVVQEEPVSTDQTPALISQQQDSSSSFDPLTSITSAYPFVHQGIDPSTITASSEPVGSSSSYRKRDSESEASSWNVDNASTSKLGWDGNIQGQRDYPAHASTYEDYDFDFHAFLLESIEHESM